MMSSKGRATRDALSEIVEGRGRGEKVYAGFLDIAYPSVWWFVVQVMEVRGWR